MHIVKCFAFAKREIMCCRTLWNISPCSMWNEICPRPRKRTFHICGANISLRSDFTCPKGQISLRTCSMAGTQSLPFCFYRGDKIQNFSARKMCCKWKIPCRALCKRKRLRSPNRWTSRKTKRKGKPSFSFLSRWQDSNLRLLRPEQIRHRFLTTFVDFLMLFSPKTMLSDALVSTVST